MWPGERGAARRGAAAKEKRVSRVVSSQTRGLLFIVLSGSEGRHRPAGPCTAPLTQAVWSESVVRVHAEFGRSGRAERRRGEKGGDGKRQSQRLKLFHRPSPFIERGRRAPGKGARPPFRASRAQHAVTTTKAWQEGGEGRRNLLAPRTTRSPILFLFFIKRTIVDILSKIRFCNHSLKIVGSRSHCCVVQYRSESIRWLDRYVVG